MRKTYASTCEVCSSNAKYHAIKFNFKDVPHLDSRRPFANEFSQLMYITYPSDILGLEGNRVVEAKEISIQLKT